MISTESCFASSCSRPAPSVHPTSRIHSNIPCWMPPKRLTLPGDTLFRGRGRVPGIHLVRVGRPGGSYTASYTLNSGGNHRFHAYAQSHTACKDASPRCGPQLAHECHRVQHLQMRSREAWPGCAPWGNLCRFSALGDSGVSIRSTPSPSTVLFQLVASPDS